MQKNSIDQLFDTLNNEEKDLFLDNRMPYMLTKAANFLNQGPEIYRKKDEFGMPLESWKEEDIKLIEEGCRQILIGKGFRKQLPLQNLGVKGCYRLFTLFHFKTISNRTNFLDNGALIEEMIFEHAMDKQKITIFNEIN